MGSRNLLFEASGMTLAAPADFVKAVHEELAVQAVAGTRHWFLGLAVVQGRLLPVTDLGAYAGRRSSSGRVVELVETVGIGAFQVDIVYGLSDVPVSDLPMDEREIGQNKDSNLALSTRAVVFDQRIHRLLDVTALMQSPAFLNIADTTH